MALSSVDLARARWGLDPDSPVIIKGDGDGLAFEDAIQTARGLMPLLVGMDGIVKKATLAELDSLFTRFGLKALPNETKDRNPPGKMLFYQRGRLLVRIKTKGDKGGYHKDKPHLSVCLMKDDKDLGPGSEMMKFSPSGNAQPKQVNKVKPEDGPFLVPIKLVGQNCNVPIYDGNDQHWGKMTHCYFPPNITIVT